MFKQKRIHHSVDLLALEVMESTHCVVPAANKMASNDLNTDKDKNTKFLLF